MSNAREQRTKPEPKALRERAEERLRSNPPEVSPKDESATLHELRVHQTELELQNHELRRTQSDLEASRNRYFGLFDLAPLPYFLFDSRHLLVDLNLAAAELVGAERGRLKGQPFFTWVAAAHRDQFHQHLNRVFEEPTAQVLECFVQRKGQAGRWVRFHSQQMLSEAGVEPICLAAAVDFTERQEAEESRRRSEAELEAIYDHAPTMMCLVNEQQKVERMNRAMADMTGGSVAHALDGSATSARSRRHDLASPNSDADLVGCFNALNRERGCGAGPQCERCPLRLALAETFKTGRSCREVESPLWFRRHGSWHQVDVSVSTTLIRVGGQSRVLVCLENITGRKQLQAQLLQAQKMEAIGQLAGGVAHDFNNILAASMMNLSLLKSATITRAESHLLLQELERSTERATSLTRQLLLFGRRQMMENQRFNLNDIVANMLTLMRRVLGEQIDIRWTVGPEPMWVEGDSGMLEQIVMNLCVNARDALVRGGEISLTIERTEVAAGESQRHPDARPGVFICLTVADTGIGMDAATLKRVFEPFFTTKEMGKGTGLGLATVYGMVKQHRGWIEVASTQGEGTTFRVFLPESPRPELAPSAEVDAAADGKGESILLVEDDEDLRKLIATSLRASGYEVIEAGNGPEAVGLWEQHNGYFDLVFTDMVMPGGMTGLDVAERLRQFKPRLKVIVSSGYSLDLAHSDGKADSSIRFLPKPYQSHTLARLLRDCLDGKA